MANFGLSDRQAQAILDMRLRRLTGLEREKIQAEYEELQALIKRLMEVLADEQLLMNIIKEELLEIKRKYADPRRTEITALDGEIDMLDLIQDEDMVVTLTHYGYVKRLPKATYRAQRRGGKGVTGATTREEDFVEQLYVTSTHDPVMFFTNRGRVYEKRCYEIPEAGRTARGTAIVNLLQLEGGEKVTAMLPVPEERVSGHYLIMATRKGTIKRTELSEFQNLRKNGLIAIVLREDDDLIAVALTDGTRDVFLGTEQGMAIRFAESDMRPIGRAAMGVKSIDLDDGDSVVAMSILEDGAQVLSLTQLGYGKRTEIEEYRVQSRAGKGIKAMNLTDKTGLLAGQLLVHEGEDLLLITDDGTVIRTPVSAISVQGRNTQGVRIMRVDEGVKVVCVARAEPEDDEDEIEVVGATASCAPGVCPNALDISPEDLNADLSGDTGEEPETVEQPVSEV